MNALGHIVVLAPLLFACVLRTSLPEAPHAETQMIDSSLIRSVTSQATVTRADTGSAHLNPSRERRLFDQSLPFRVLHMTRNNKTNTSSQDTTVCVGWSLTEGTCKKVLAGFVAISGYDWGELFDVLPCQCEGELEQAEGRFKFAINAGSWLSVQCGDTTLYFGDMDKKFKKQFISTVWTGE